MTAEYRQSRRENAAARCGTHWQCFSASYSNVSWPLPIGASRATTIAGIFFVVGWAAFMFGAMNRFRRLENELRSHSAGSRSRRERADTGTRETRCMWAWRSSRLRSGCFSQHGGRSSCCFRRWQSCSSSSSWPRNVIFSVVLALNMRPTLVVFAGGFDEPPFFVARGARHVQIISISYCLTGPKFRTTAGAAISLHLTFHKRHALQIRRRVCGFGPLIAAFRIDRPIDVIAKLDLETVLAICDRCRGARLEFAPLVLRCLTLGRVLPEHGTVSIS